jgi:hypothetical protein
MRRVAINTVKNVTTAFGSDRSGKSASIYERSSSSRSDGEMAAALVTGCLIEEISKKDQESEFDDCWGTFSERAELL